jgi:hypothetical protein
LRKISLLTPILLALGLVAVVLTVQPATAAPSWTCGYLVTAYAGVPNKYVASYNFTAGPGEQAALDWGDGNVIIVNNADGSIIPPTNRTHQYSNSSGYTLTLRVYNNTHTDFVKCVAHVGSSPTAVVISSINAISGPLVAIPWVPDVLRFALLIAGVLVFICLAATGFFHRI